MMTGCPLLNRLQDRYLPVLALGLCAGMEFALFAPAAAGLLGTGTVASLALYVSLSCLPLAGVLVIAAITCTGGAPFLALGALALVSVVRLTVIVLASARSSGPASRANATATRNSY